MDIGEILRMTAPVSDETVAAVESVLETVSVRKREAIVEQGKRSLHIFFVKEGIFRMSYADNGLDDTICFGMDGDPFMSLHSYYRHEPAQFSCIALTDAEVYRIGFEQFDILMQKHTDLLMWLKNVLIEQLYAFERRYVYLAKTSAYERYEVFMKIRAEIVSQIPSKYVAQYLKMRPETLYRIRARYCRD